MSDGLNFFTTLDFGSLVPGEYGRYRAAVNDGLIFFLSELSADRALAILAEQAALPAGTGIDERLVAIARHSPALHKLGQVMARDRRLPPNLRRLLQHLESMAPTWALDDLRAGIERELGPLEPLAIRLDEPPLAEASVAVVVPFVWQDPAGGMERRGVFKVLKDGIEDRLAEDLDLLQRVGALLDKLCHEYRLPEIEYEATFAQVRDLLAREVHLDREQEHLRLARTAYRAMPSVVVPEVLPFSTPRMTAMERIDGRKVTAVEDLPPAARRALAGLVIKALIAQPIWSFDSQAMFHADPHAGNLLVTPDGRLGILDWSLVGSLDKRDRERLSQIMLGAVTLDAGAIVRAIAGLSEGPVDALALQGVVEEALARIPAETLPGLSWLTALMDQVLTRSRARFGADLVMFRKVLLTLEGVVADVSDDFPLNLTLAWAFLSRLGFEWGPRAMALPFQRDFPTHLSNADIAQLTMVAPMTAWRYLLRLYESRAVR